MIFLRTNQIVYQYDLMTFFFFMPGGIMFSGCLSVRPFLVSAISYERLEGISPFGHKEELVLEFGGQRSSSL